MHLNTSLARSWLLLLQYGFAGMGIYGIMVKEAIEGCEVRDRESFLMLLMQILTTKERQRGRNIDF